MHEIAACASIDAPGSASSASFDAIIIGAGLGGLLSAAQLLQRGKRVLVLERLSHAGGRFTAKTFQGVQVSTGAVHMVPFGSSGVLSQMLQALHIPHHLFDADVFGSFHVYGKQYRSRGLLGVLRFLGLRQSSWFMRLGYLLFFRPLPASERGLAFDLWLEKQIDVSRNPQLVAFFASIARFALSLELSQVSTGEVIRITKNMLRFGAPGIVQGGCGELTRQLEKHIREHGGDLRLSSPVEQICVVDGRVTGVRVQDKQTGVVSFIPTTIVVSDIGPRATEALLHNQRVTQNEVLKQKQHVAADQNDQGLPADGFHEAVGLKVHILSDVSLIPHKGIMYCLDTQRIAGMVQPTNSDPQMAPPGKHLLISHQVIRSDSLEEERALALADLRYLFGPTFDTHCRILTMATYRGEWPVNRIVQGEDSLPEMAVHGLYQVGDAVKPAGYLMVEGVAQSVNYFLDLLDALDRDQKHPPAVSAFIRSRSNVVKPPSRLNALRWLWKAPGNSGKHVGKGV